nr:immunoglobulin heavy chain junction region [Mus musculus]MBK4186839.1 immunoglobulin heavy chain junction region [Mus musculus]MBK4195185.1 immunoglobulin heavy chain junction region [Mus musculus]
CARMGDYDGGFDYW